MVAQIQMAPEIEGMVIAADGGDDPVVVKNLTEAVQALFGVEAKKKRKGCLTALLVVWAVFTRLFI